MRSLGLSLVAVLVGCGGPKPSSAPPAIANRPAPAAEPAAPAPSSRLPGEFSDAEFAAMMDDVVAMFAAMGAAVDAGGSDCGKIALGLDATLDAHAPLLASMRQWKQHSTMDQRTQVWLNDHMDQIMPPLMKVGEAGQRCGADPQFQATTKRLDALN